jgi:hypothetical protein
MSLVQQHPAPVANDLSQWQTMVLVVPASIAPDGVDTRHPVRVRTGGAGDAEDPIFVPVDVMAALGSENPGNRSTQLKNVLKTTVLKNKTVEMQIPDKEGGRLCNVVQVLRLSQLKAFLTVCRSPLSQAFLGTWAGLGLRTMAGDVTVVDDAGRYAVAMQALQQLDPSNILCLLGKAAERANRGSPAPAIDDARAASGAAAVIPALMGNHVAAAVDATLGSAQTAEAARLRLALGFLDLEERRQRLDQTRVAFAQKMRAALAAEDDVNLRMLGSDYYQNTVNRVLHSGAPVPAIGCSSVDAASAPHLGVVDIVRNERRVVMGLPLSKRVGSRAARAYRERHGVTNTNSAMTVAQGHQVSMKTYAPADVDMVLAAYDAEMQARDGV